MYGFGDVSNPLPESVDMMEDLVIEYVTEMTHLAFTEVARGRRLKKEDIIFLIRNDRKKYARVKELLEMNEILKQAKKTVNINDF